MTAENRPSALAPFRVRSFRFQWPGDLFTSCAFEMETLILGWYVLVETQSVLMLTLFGALQFAGTLISPLFGVAGDRLGSRNLLCAMRALYASLAAVLAGFALADALSPAVVLAITAISGAVRPSDQGVRVALVADIMPADLVPTAISLARITSDSARVAGALSGAGLFAALGIGPAALAVAVLYLLGLLFTRGVSAEHANQGSEVPQRSPARDLLDGLVYVAETPRLLAMICLAFLVNLTAFPLSHGLLPYFAREVFQTDQTGLGYLIASFALGGLLGSVVLSVFARGVRQARTTLVSTVAWYAFVFAFSRTQNEAFALGILFLAGFAQSFSMVPSSILLMQASSPAYRGRVMGVRMLAVNGLPIGLLAAGTLTGVLSISGVVAIFALIGMLFTAAIAWRWNRDLSRIDASGATHREPR